MVKRLSPLIIEYCSVTREAAAVFHSSSEIGFRFFPRKAASYSGVMLAGIAKPSIGINPPRIAINNKVNNFMAWV